jgi:hypothetical protein
VNESAEGATRYDSIILWVCRDRTAQAGGMTPFIIAAAVAVIVVPPAFVAWSLCRVAADCDRAMEAAFDGCAACDGPLEYDSEGSNICTSCGVTTHRRVRS